MARYCHDHYDARRLAAALTTVLLSPYTWVSDEYRNRLIESALRRRLEPGTKKEVALSW